MAASKFPRDQVLIQLEIKLFQGTGEKERREPGWKYFNVLSALSLGRSKRKRSGITIWPSFQDHHFTRPLSEFISFV